MIKISEQLEKLISKELNGKIGHYSDFGAVIEDCEFILIYKQGNFYLAHISEFEQDGIFVRLKEEK